jgi:hypothetical protein
VGKLLPSTDNCFLWLQKDSQRGTLPFELGQGFSFNLSHPFVAQMEIEADLA